jgi:hypothetical protein
MDSALKLRIVQMLNTITDENILTQVMNDVSFYAEKGDVTDVLSPQQMQELDAAILEADNDETVSWNDFKQEMKAWPRK